MGKKKWNRVDNMLFLSDTTSDQDSLEPGMIYSLEITPKQQLFLKEVGMKFSFNFKIYGLERPFIDKVKKAYSQTTGNMGILLNGLKGTGKTVTGEVIANELNLPIILINQPHSGISSYISDIEQDVIVFIDEFEKVFKGQLSEDDYDFDPEKHGDTTLLSLMSGTYSTEFRRFFILTTNRLWINDNLLNRPGRIRYSKEFGDLNLTQITEILDDLLVEKQFKDDIISFLKPLKIITVDIVKTVISEVNIFNETPFDCCKDLNVEMKEEEYKAIRLVGGKEEVIAEGLSAKMVNHFVNNSVWKSVQINMSPAGVFKNKTKPDKDKGIFTLVDYYDESANAIRVRFEKVQPIHNVFVR